MKFSHHSSLLHLGVVFGFFLSFTCEPRVPNTDTSSLPSRLAFFALSSSPSPAPACPWLPASSLPQAGDCRRSGGGQPGLDPWNLIWRPSPPTQQHPLLACKGSLQTSACCRDGVVRCVGSGWGPDTLLSWPVPSTLASGGPSVWGESTPPAKAQAP